MTLQFVLLDDSASQAAEMAGLSGKSAVVEARGPLAVFKPEMGRVPVFVMTRFDEKKLATLADYRGKGILLYPQPDDDKALPESLMRSELVLMPVRLESLATLSFSHTMKSLELLFNEFSPDDFNLGHENHFEVLQSGMINRFFHTEGKHLKEAVLRMAHRVRSQRTREAVAYTLRVPANTPLFALDEAIDVLEIAVPPERPILFAVRFDKSPQSPVRVSACIATPGQPAGGVQARVDAQPTYLGKTVVIVEAFAFREIDEKEMEKLCRDNGIEPDDADRFYDLIYARSDETADLIRDLAGASGQGARVELIAQKLADGFIDARVLEELSRLFGLDPRMILQPAEELKKKTVT
jgi:hypothetical protein